MSDAQFQFPPGFGPETYGASFADVYDQWYPTITDADATAAFLANRCSPAIALELGVGTGRLVPALIGAGLAVVGIDSSIAMLTEMANPRPGRVLHGVADMMSLPVRTGTVGAAICAFNTLFNLPSAPMQETALAEAARAVRPGGAVIVEAITGDSLAESHGQSVGVSRISATGLVLAATVVDHAQQTVTGQHLEISEAGIRLRPWHLRWSTPAQLDAMAAAVGLHLAERYSDWDQSPYTNTSEKHVSVYRTIS